MKHFNASTWIFFVLLFGCPYSIYANSSHSTHYAQIQATVSGPTGEGKVYVGTALLESDNGYQANSCTKDFNCAGDEANDTYMFYFATKEVTNWLWDGWYDGTTQKSLDYQYTETLDFSESSTDKNNPTSYVRTATWLRPSVVKGTAPSVPIITDPANSINVDVVFELKDDRSADNYSNNSGAIQGSFIPCGITYERGKYTFPILYTPQDIHGIYSTTATLLSKYDGSTASVTITVQEDYTPTFNLSTEMSFGNTKTSGYSTQSVAPTSPSYAATLGEWSTYIDGADATYFSIANTGADGIAHPEQGNCSVTFTPRDGDRDYSATLHLTCSYTDAAGQMLQYAQTTTLSGKGYTPVEASLSLANDATNAGNFTAGTPSTYVFPAQYGTITKGAAFSIGYSYLSEPVFRWTGNDEGVFAEVTGNAHNNGSVTALPIVINAHAATAVETATTYTATLTITGNSTIEGEESKTLSEQVEVSVTIYPKKANTLAWALEKYSGVYVLYTDQTNHPAFKDRNNIETPITISSSYAQFSQYVDIDNENNTLTPLKLMTTSRNVHAEQPESDEYEGIVLDTVMQVRKHALAWTYPQVDPMSGTGQRLYRNTRYDKILSTNSIDAGEATGFSEFRYSTDPAPAFGQTLIDNGDGTYGMQTGDLTGTISFVANIAETENYTGRNSTSAAISFYIIRDPIHVPVGLGSVSKLTSGNHIGELSGLWLNNANYMYGSTFKVSEYKATWIGYDWDATNKVWTGTNTGRTDWTSVANQGNTNAFALEDGGYVVFHFLGVPMYTYFAMYFTTATSDGSVKLEESADGITWTETTPGSTSATYLSSAGGKNMYMKGTSRYIRFSYSGNNHVVIAGTNIYENTYIRTNFTTNNADKLHISKTTYQELNKNPDGTWGTFPFVLRAANWSKADAYEITSSNPDFIVVWDEALPADGLDTYKEIPMHVEYKGDAMYASTTITIENRDFYSRTATDTLRSLSFEVRAVGTGVDMPEIITNANKTTKYLTGTVGPFRGSSVTNWEETTALFSQTRGEDPHTGLSENDFSACFDSEGNALFDKLYIFGVTGNNNGATITYPYYYKEGDEIKTVASGTRYFPSITTPTGTAPSNAVTPCYVYTKNGNQYVLAETIANMNVATKPIGTITASGQKLYFSGFCPVMSIGYQGSDIGAIHVQGAAGQSVDIYLDNCQLTARVKRQDGCSGTSDAVKYTSTSEVKNKYIPGSGSILAFESTSTQSAAPFHAKVHLRGENFLKSNTGSYISVNIYGQSANATQSSAPIHLYTTSGNIYTKLTIDDEWTNGTTTIRTNGGLRLRKTTNQSPSIDLGNTNSEVHFNGGRINLHNAWPSSEQYMTTMAISCRSYTKSVSIISLTMYGLGQDSDGGKVYFNDGTISVLPLDFSNDPNNYSAYYYDNISIKCPSQTFVDGGNYISTIWACSSPTVVGASPTNKHGDAVVSHTMKATSTDPITGLATIDFPSDLICEEHTTDPIDYYNMSLSDYYDYWYEKDGSAPYGQASLSPNDSNYVQLFLPAKFTGKPVIVEKDITPWAFCSTEIKAGTSAITQTIGGPCAVSYSGSEQTNFLLWTQIDENIRNAATSEYRTPIIPGGNIQVEAQVFFDDNSNNNSSITNTEPYEIASKIYLMVPAEADRWKAFCAPFDISNVYVFDTYPYSALKDMNRAQALSVQGTANLDLAFFIGNPICGMGNASQDLSSFVGNFFRYVYGQDTTSGVYPREKNTKIVNGVETPYYPTNYLSAKDYTSDYRGQNLLEPYMGNNSYTANYFLYHSANKEWAYDGHDFETDWEFVTPVTKTIGDTEHEVLMQQGEIYALQFPYMGSADDPNTREVFDYWTGKLILFEGYGPQMLQGTAVQSEQFTPYTTPNSGSLRGNMTLADMQVPNYSGAAGELDNAFFLTDNRDIFEPANDKASGTLVPTGVFLLANPNTRNSARIASINVRSGLVTYTDEETPTGVPTIAGGHTLLVGSDKEGLAIKALKPQHVYVYSATGQLIASQWLDGDMEISVPQGLYIVRGAEEEAKAIVP